MSWGEGGQAPSDRDTKPWFCVAARGGKHPHAQDTKSKDGIHRIRITQTFVFARLGRGGMPPPTRDAKPLFCVAN